MRRIDYQNYKTDIDIDKITVLWHFYSIPVVIVTTGSFAQRMSIGVCRGQFNLPWVA